MDYIKRFTTREGVRMSLAVTTDTVETARVRHDLWPVATAALGRAMTGAILLAGDFKNHENVSLRIKGDGPLGVVHVDAFSDNTVRGYVDDPHVDVPLKHAGKLDVGSAVGHNGEVQVTRFTQLAQDYTSTSPIQSGEVAEDLAYYLYASEQVPSTISLGVLVDPDYHTVVAGGFIVRTSSIRPLPSGFAFKYSVIGPSSLIFFSTCANASSVASGKACTIKPPATTVW